MEATSQSIDIAPARSDKWTHGAMGLIELTQKGKLVWRRLTEPSDFYSEIYESTLSGNTLRLQTTGITADALEKPLHWSPPFGISKPSVRNERHYPSLRVTSKGETVTVFPDVAALQGLAEAVQERAKAKDESFLQAIHQEIKQIAE